jgi:hypothetical protein
LGKFGRPIEDGQLPASREILGYRFKAWCEKDA